MAIIEWAGRDGSVSQPLTEIEGYTIGAGVSFILVNSDQPGIGPKLHRHPYPETFVILAGRARFTVGEEHLIGVGGQIIVVPAHTPHSFAVEGPGSLEMTDIHASDRFITEWLEGPSISRRGSSGSETE